MIKAPGKPSSFGKVTRTYLDLVDVFPTVSALAGLPSPAGVDGDDLSAAFDDPAVTITRPGSRSTPYHSP